MHLLYSMNCAMSLPLNQLLIIYLALSKVALLNPRTIRINLKSFKNFVLFVSRFFLTISCAVKYRLLLSTALLWMKDASGKGKSDIWR